MAKQKTFEDAVLLALKLEEGAINQEMQVGNGKGMDSSLKPSQGTQACQHFHFGPVRSTSDFGPLRF